MPKNKGSDPITDQEIAFACLVLSGAMTDRQAAEAVGLNPDSAAYTKSKPRVHDYMLEHRAAVQQQLVQQEAERQYRFNLDREQVLKRLWELANLSPEMTRSSITGQVKAISMIVAMENFIPDRRAGSSEKKSAPAPVNAQIYASAWRRGQEATTVDPQPSTAPAQQEAQQENSPSAPEPKHAPGSAGQAPPNPNPSQSTFANPLSPSQAPPVTPYGPGFSFVPDARGPYVPDTRVPFSIKKNPFARPR
jgi:hypothetical protein